MNMIDIQITRLIAAAIAAVLLGWACYVTAYVKHKNAVKDETNKVRLEERRCELYEDEEIRLEKSQTWYVGYCLALVGLMIAATVVGWAAAYIVSGEYVLTWAEDAAVAAAAAVIGGMILDKFIIHPIADGKFFEKVEDPMVAYFLENGTLPVKEVKLSRKEKKVKEKKEEAPNTDIPVENVPPDFDSLFKGLTFDEKVKAIEMLRKTL